MKLLFLVCFLAVLPQFSNGKNYYLVNDEKSASEYVYGLFGLTNVVDKGVSGLNSIKNKIFGNKQKYDLGKHQITHNRPKYQSPTDQSALTNITMCYYLGDDIETSHLQYNDQWKYDSRNLNGLYNYINQLTLGANTLLGLHNYKLKWKGPYGRSDKAEKYPSSDNLKYDVLQASTVGCDVVVFLVFNDFSTGQNTDGHKYSGFANGAPCEASQASGYTVIVDQGFYGDVWMGPQILAHHLLLMLTADLFQPNDPRRYCNNEYSLLHKNIKAGEQYVDQCIIDMLNNSDISIRQCLLDF